MDKVIGYLVLKKGELQAHLCGWVLFVLYDAVIGGFVKGSFGTVGNYIIHYTINISLFYFNANIALPEAFRIKNHLIWRLPLLIALELLLYELVIYYIDLFFITYTNILNTSGLIFNNSFILAYIWRGLYFIFFSTGFYLFKRYKEEQEQNEVLKQQQFDFELKQKSIEKEMAEAKTSFLMAQINPHFLFNTLNFIYYTAAKKSPEAANSIMLLSRIMRYSSDISNLKDLVYLSKEVEYIHWLIQIYRLRFGDKFHVSFFCCPDAMEWKLIPFLIITVAENMFKHGVTSDEKHVATMKIVLDSKRNLVITSQNLPKSVIEINGLNSGLSNLQERMRYQYGNLATLDYNYDVEGQFILYILIPHEFKNI